MKENNKFIAFFKQNTFIFAIFAGLFVFLGLAFPLLNAHGVTYDPVTWEFGETSRVVHNASIMFGMDGPVVWPLIIIYSLVIIAIALLPFSRINDKILIVAMLLFFVSGVMLLLSNYFYSYANAIHGAKENLEAIGDEYYYWFVSEYIKISDSRLGVGSILASIMCFISAIICFANQFSKERVTVREMTEIGMLVAAAVVLDLIFHYIPNIPGQVGSISVALLPLYILALRHGPAKGLLAASFVYGLITCFTDNYGIWLYPLDYMVAFSGVAIIGFFKKQIIGEEIETYNIKGEILIFVSIMLAGMVRLIGSGTSSILNYNYTLNAAIAANGLYTLLSSLACAIVLMAAYDPIIRLNKMFPVRKA